MPFGITAKTYWDAKEYSQKWGLTLEQRLDLEDLLDTHFRRGWKRNEPTVVRCARSYVKNTGTDGWFVAGCDGKPIVDPLNARFCYRCGRQK